MGPFVTFNLSESKVSGYQTMDDYKADQTIRVATLHAKNGWKVLDNEGFFENLEIEMREDG